MPNPTSAKRLREIRFSDISSADITFFKIILLLLFMFDLRIKLPLSSITILAESFLFALLITSPVHCLNSLKIMPLFTM